MQNIIIEKPYQFVPPYRGTFWSALFQWLDVPGWYLRNTEGVDECECRGLSHLKASISAGHSVLIAPNHPRTADPLSMGFLARQTGCHMYALASWHLFHQGRLRAWAINRMGAFSVNREGVDRQAISTAVELLAEARRPLVVFPEGATSRTNDHLHALLDGVAFIARSAAKKRSRQKPPGKVVVHPVAIKYLFRGDLPAAADEVLSEIEQRLSWQPQCELPLLQRVAKVGLALLSLKELEYFGETRRGKLAVRLQALIDRLLGPLEQEWLGAVQQGSVVARVRTLRVKILPEMVAGRIAATERERRWRQLHDIYLAQQLACYPPDYLVTQPTVDRVLETIERFEEDLTDKVRHHGRFKVVLQVGEAIEVTPERDRTAPIDPLMTEIQHRLQAMLAPLAAESPLVQAEPKADPST